MGAPASSRRHKQAGPGRRGRDLTRFGAVTVVPNPNPGPDAQDRLRPVFTILARVVYEYNGESVPEDKPTPDEAEPGGA